MNSPDRALFIQLRRIGDILMCTPAIRALKKRYPDCKIDFLTEYPDVLNGNRNLDNIISVDPSRQFSPSYQYRLIRNLRKSRYNLVVDFLANPRSAYYSFLTGAETRLSYGYGHRRWAYNLTSPRPENPIYAALDRLHLMRALDVESNDPHLEFYPTDKDRDKAARLLNSIPADRIITVSPVSRREYRRWPLDRFAELCHWLKTDFDFHIVVVVGPGEENYGLELFEMLKSVNPLLLNVNSLGVLGALFERAFFHIGNDNGPKHIAVAMGTPTFAIFGSDNPISWTYPDSARHLFISPPDIDPVCKSSGHKCGPECIRKISAKAVYEKLKPMIQNLNLEIRTPEPK